MGRERMGDFMGHTRAVLFWHGGGGAVVALDQATGEVSCSELPRTECLDERAAALKVTAGGDGEACILGLVATAVGGGILKVFTLAPQRGEWVLEKTVELAAVACGLPGYRPSCSAGEPAPWMIKVMDTVLVAVWRRGDQLYVFTAKPAQGYP